VRGKLENLRDNRISQVGGVERHTECVRRSSWKHFTSTKRERDNSVLLLALHRSLTIHHASH